MKGMIKYQQIAMLIIAVKNPRIETNGIRKSRIVDYSGRRIRKYFSLLKGRSSLQSRGKG